MIYYYYLAIFAEMWSVSHVFPHRAPYQVSEEKHSL